MFCTIQLLISIFCLSLWDLWCLCIYHQVTSISIFYTLSVGTWCCKYICPDLQLILAVILLSHSFLWCHIYSLWLPIQCCHFQSLYFNLPLLPWSLFLAILVFSILLQKSLISSSELLDVGAYTCTTATLIGWLASHWLLLQLFLSWLVCNPGVLFLLFH